MERMPVGSGSSRRAFIRSIVMVGMVISVCLTAASAVLSSGSLCVESIKVRSLRMAPDPSSLVPMRSTIGSTAATVCESRSSTLTRRRIIAVSRPSIRAKFFSPPSRAISSSTFLSRMPLPPGCSFATWFISITSSASSL